jgi:hypothetical protein
MYIFPEFDDLLVVKDIRDADDPGLALSSSSIHLVNMNQILICEINVLILLEVHFNNF